MITDIQRRNRILKKIYRIPKDKLRELDEFLSKLEEDVNHKSQILSFAGSWKDIDQSVFDTFTKDLISNRKKNRKRIDE
ncbi:MAG: hypothetical protein GXO86_09795 [Chlorobi bacterium]|nr:hypothetical protein [Chlorobiota bacterium]